jgi:hypothetical protein
MLKLNKFYRYVNMNPIYNKKKLLITSSLFHNSLFNIHYFNEREYFPRDYKEL